MTYKIYTKVIVTVSIQDSRCCTGVYGIHALGLGPLCFFNPNWRSHSWFMSHPVHVHLGFSLKPCQENGEPQPTPRRLPFTLIPVSVHAHAHVLQSRSPRHCTLSGYCSYSGCHLPCPFCSYSKLGDWIHNNKFFHRWIHVAWQTARPYEVRSLMTGLFIISWWPKEDMTCLISTLYWGSWMWLQLILNNSATCMLS